MTAAEDIPLWAAIIVSALVVIGALLALVGAIGFLRFRTFYERLHAPAIAATQGRLPLAQVLADFPVALLRRE